MTVEWPAVIGGLVVLQIACAIFGAYVAEEKHRHSAVWFFLCLVFGLIALIAVAGIPEGSPAGRPERSARRELAPTAWNPLEGPPPAE